MSEWKTVRLGDVCGGSLPLAPTSLVATPSAGATPATPAATFAKQNVVKQSKIATHTDLFAANAAHGIMEN